MRRVRPWLLGIAGILLLALLWEGYKAVMPVEGWVVNGVTILPRTSPQAMPHIWDIVARALEPETRAATALPLWVAMLKAAALTLGLAGAGWAIGVAVGLLLATLMQRFRTAESALLPWVILSQTVPLIALAPILKRSLSQVHIGAFTWQGWMSVALIAAYLAFFPVSVGALRGFGSPEKAHLDLMRAYGMGWWRTFLKVRVPASVPHLLPALRLAAANAVVGAVVAEVSTGLDGGIGRMIITSAQTGSADPARMWTPIIGAVLIGLVAAGIVGIIGAALRRYRRREATA